jgi:hypothetical protein
MNMEQASAAEAHQPLAEEHPMRSVMACLPVEPPLDASHVDVTLPLAPDLPAAASPATTAPAAATMAPAAATTAPSPAGTSQERSSAPAPAAASGSSQQRPSLWSAIVAGAQEVSAHLSTILRQTVRPAVGDDEEDPCPICFANAPTFQVGDCEHALCTTCAVTYVRTAIGDARTQVSGEGVRCPMHGFDGCLTHITPERAAELCTAVDRRRLAEIAVAGVPLPGTAAYAAAENTLSKRTLRAWERWSTCPCRALHPGPSLVRDAVLTGAASEHLVCTGGAPRHGFVRRWRCALEGASLSARRRPLKIPSR